MMIKLDEKIELCQISLTGIRSLLLLGLLVIAPRTLSEIRQTLIDYKILDESSSDDILRIDLNTIKSMGCEISRASARTNYKYVLTKHPFGLSLTEAELEILRKVYKNIKSTADLNLLIQLDELFRKISSFVFDNKTKEILLGISFLKRYNNEMIKNLISDCEQGLTLEIDYKKPTSKNSTIKRIVAQKLVYKSDQIYLYGYDTEKNESVTLNLSRIKAIISRVLGNGSFEQNLINVRFRLKDFGVDILDSNENIVESDKNGHIIEGFYYNEFLAVQRMLSLGKNCIVIEPESLKNTIIEKLKEMRKIYGD